MLVAVILTKNEELHIKRCLESVKKVVDHVIVVDSGSSDETCNICARYEVPVVFNEWKNYSHQFNFGLTRAQELGASYVLRIDADEYIDKHLETSISAINFDNDDVGGYYLKRHITFLGKLIRYGGATPISVIRIFRADSGFCESRWMDEHIIVRGKTKVLQGRLIDDSLKDINWWINKHLWYAERECIDILTSPHQTNAELNVGSNKIKRFIKGRIYNKLPLGVRPALYFIYRYFLRFGFADGFKGFLFHFLQGFWYRTMVDYKVLQVREKQHSEGLTLETAIKELFGFDINS